MNTGMQDAFDLAWKLALVEQGLARQSLLDSYSAERSPVARQILANSGRIIRVAMVRSRVVQDVRNFLAHRILGFVDAQHAFADRLSEVTIGCPGSPLNSGSSHKLEGPGPGRQILDSKPFGAGDQPRFALMATDHEVRALMQDYAPLLEAEFRSPPNDDSVRLVRPDGYVAAVARAGESTVIRDCLGKIAERIAVSGARSTKSLLPVT